MHSSRFVRCLLVALAALGGLYGYLHLLDGTLIRRVIDLPAGYVTTTQGVYRHGETVRYYITFCKYRNVPAEIQWTLINETVTFYAPEQRSINQTGCFTDFISPAKEIPPGVHPGTYHFSATVKYQTNKLRTISYQIQTTDFEVTDVPTSSQSTFQAPD